MASNIQELVKKSLAYLDQGNQSGAKENLRRVSAILQDYSREMYGALGAGSDSTEIKKILSAYGFGTEENGSSKENKRLSWYDRLVEKDVPTYIMAKIPGAVKGGTSYKGFREGAEGRLSGGRVEEYHGWFINGWPEKDYPRFLGRADKDTLAVARDGSLLYVEFFKRVGPVFDSRYVETRDFRGMIAYRLPKEMMDEVWDDLANNRSDAYQLIDPELLGLISLTSNLKTVLIEK